MDSPFEMEGDFEVKLLDVKATRSFEFSKPIAPLNERILVDFDL